MKKIDIIRGGVVTNSASFETEELLNEWLATHEAMGTFGALEVRGDVEVSPAEYEEQDVVTQEESHDEDGVVIPQITEKRLVKVKDAVIENQVITPADYQVIIIDLTHELEVESQTKEALKFLADTDWLCMRHANERDMGMTTTLSNDDYFELLEQRQEARDKVVR